MIDTHRPACIRVCKLFNGALWVIPPPNRYQHIPRYTVEQTLTGFQTPLPEIPSLYLRFLSLVVLSSSRGILSNTRLSRDIFGHELVRDLLQGPIKSRPCDRRWMKGVLVPSKYIVPAEVSKLTIHKYSVTFIRLPISRPGC